VIQVDVVPAEVDQFAAPGAGVRGEAVEGEQPVLASRYAGRRAKVTVTGPERRALSESAPSSLTVLHVRASRGRAFGAPLTLEPTQRA
jgi:hypothetical protein